MCVGVSVCLVGVVSVWRAEACDIKLVSYSSIITMMHGPIHIKHEVEE